jgi:putative ABC transport system permease protein
MGFKKDNILVIPDEISSDRISVLRNLLEEIAGVEKLSFPCGTPLDGGSNNSFDLNGEPYSVQEFRVDSAFFDIFGIEVEPTGIGPSNDMIWLNRKAYDTFRPDSITQIVELGWGQHFPVVGVTNDFSTRSLHWDARLVVIRVRPEGWMAWNVVVKINDAANLLKTAEEIKRVYAEFNGGEPFDAKFVDETVQQWYEREERMVKLLTAFTTLTFLILLMGILAMSLYYVKQKEKEIGVRKVNGATEQEILAMLNYNFVWWIIVAFIIAVPIAYYAMSRWLENFAYKTTLSWWVFALTGVIVLLLSVLFISIQSWKAATANPVESLKSE